MDKKSKKLICYIPVGLNDNTFNIELISSICDSGADIVEVGLPFSDPGADGDVIQKANIKALKNNYKIQSALCLSKDLQKNNIDFVYMGYFNTFYQKGFDVFLQDNSKGCIIPDLPYEESIAYLSQFEKYNKTLIPLIAPTTPLDRIEKLVCNNPYFIYLVAYAGVTGSNVAQKDLSLIINKIREMTNSPLYLGFGVTPQNIQEKVKDVDGVIVGSYIVNILLDDSISKSEQMQKINDVVKDMKNKIV